MSGNVISKLSLSSVGRAYTG